MVVKGFGVPNQGRSRIRKPLKGEYKGYKWMVEYTKEGVFEWRVSAGSATMSGFTPPKSEVATALMEIRESTKIFDEIKKYDRAITQGLSDLFNRLNRWKRMALQHRLSIKVKRRKNGSVYYVVEEK